MQEKRKASRRKLPFKLTAAVQAVLEHLTGGSKTQSRKARAFKARVIDLSRDGAGLFTRVFSFKPYKTGMRVAIDMELSDGSTIPAEGEIRWTSPDPAKRGHYYGVYFTRVDPENRDRMHQFLLELDRVL